MSKPRSLFLLFHGRFPGEKAAALFAGKSAESFADVGLTVTLVVPRRLGRSKQDPFQYYSLKKNFNIVYIPTIDLFPLGLGTLAFYISFWVYTFFTLVYLLTKFKKGDIVYSNESLPLFYATFFFKNTLYEVHDFPERKIGFYTSLFRRLTWVLATNTWKYTELQKRFKIPERKLIREPNGVELGIVIL